MDAICPVEPRPQRPGIAVPQSGQRPSGGQRVVLNEIAVPLDQQRAAVVAAGVLEVADAAWQVARIDVAQPLRRAISAACTSISGVVFSGSLIR